VTDSHQISDRARSKMVERAEARKRRRQHRAPSRIAGSVPIILIAVAAMYIIQLMTQTKEIVAELENRL